MKTILAHLLVLACACVISKTAWSAQTAQADLVNSSLRLNTSACDCDIGGLVWYMDFSSVYVEERPAANHELAPFPQPAAYSHRSYMVLEDASMWTSTSFLELNLPVDDINENGMPDFFEPGIAVSTSSGGRYQIEWGPCPLTVVWSRPAGMTTGSYQLTMNDSMLGNIGPFRGSFELVETHGSLHYMPAASEVTGDWSFPSTSVTAQLSGAVRFVKSAADPFNKLTLQPGALTNELDNLAFEASTLNREGSVYRGPFRLPTGSYASWTLLITDPNDSDHDGIPDLSDSVALPPPNKPALSLKSTATGLQLSIAGNTGRTCHLEETPSLNPSSWAVAKTFTLTSDPHLIDLTHDSGALPKFWRVRVE